MTWPRTSITSPRTLATAARLARVTMAAVLLAPSCQRSEERSGAGARPVEPGLPADTAFLGDQPVPAWEVLLRQETVWPDSATMGEEPAPIRELRRQLARRSVLESRLLLHAQRAAWELPEQALPGGAADLLYLVMRPRSEQLALVSHRRKRYRAGSPARLAAWLEGALRPTPPLIRFEVLARTDERTGLDGRPARRELHLLAVLKSQGGDGPPVELRRRVLVSSEESPPHLRSQAAFLWDAVFLPYLGGTSLPLLDLLREGGHWPRQVEILPTQVQHGGMAGAGWRISLDPAAGRARQVPRLWLRLPPERYEQEFGPILFRPSRRLLHRSTRGLRDKGQGEPTSEPLAVRNSGTRTLYVYADGLLLGWVGPRQEAHWKVLPPGYYRMAAHSLFGTELWGPQDSYVPGPVSLATQ